MEPSQASYKLNQAARDNRKGELRHFQTPRFDYNERAESPRDTMIPNVEQFQQQPPPYSENYTMVRDLSMEQPDDSRDRIDSYSNDSLINLTGEELAQREREIYGEKYQQKDLGDLPASPPNEAMLPAIPELNIDSRIPSFIPQEIHGQEVLQEVPQEISRAQHRSIGDYAWGLMMWRNMKDSMVIFSLGGFLLFSLAYFSFISVLAYTSLSVLLLATGLVFGRHIIYQLQQRQGQHPFQKLLKRDVVISTDYAHQQLDELLVPFNQSLVRMRNLFLADSLAQSLKLAFLMYLLTYVGAWFNLLTLAMGMWVMAFTLPKLYVMYRPQIDGLTSRILRRMRQAKDWVMTVFLRQKDRMVAAKERVMIKKGRSLKVEKKVTIEEKDQ